MGKEKLLKDHHIKVVYSEDDWILLKEKRDRAINLLYLFAKEGIDPFIFGSIARGDVHRDSDIDLLMPALIPPYQIEFILHKNGFEKYFREIIMATPNDSLKLYIYLSELESITIPLSKFDKKSREFYDFGGKVNFIQLKNNIRIPGINKKLVLIKPNLQGHEEYSIIGNEHLAAKDTGVSIDTIFERKNVLIKREKKGKTGVFLKRSIEIDESTEEVLKDLANKKSIIRQKLYEK